MLLPPQKKQESPISIIWIQFNCQSASQSYKKSQAKLTFRLQLSGWDKIISHFSLTKRKK
uniref:Uncharacterized protein n=1 Tax=Anguilla anguilla TaxID=7936 RepID=A0A0E9X855_ANGAN